MKKTDLVNCPKWLLDADTLNEDVEIIDGILVWRGGEWRGGEWWGGDWWDGVWQGGVWRGGEWWGGEWRGGEWWGGVWQGGKVNSTEGKVVLTFAHCEGYAKTLIDVAGTAYVLAGCHFFTLDEARSHWASRNDRPLTRALLEGAYALARLQGLKTGGV